MKNMNNNVVDERMKKMYSEQDLKFLEQQFKKESKCGKLSSNSGISMFLKNMENKSDMTEMDKFFKDKLLSS